MSLLGAWALVALLADPAPAWPAPDRLALPGYRVHLIVSEDLDPDLLGPLARENVVLWLKTRSNTLRESTVENVARFRTALVELRPPLSAQAMEQLSKARGAGAWIDESSLGGEGLHSLGPRSLAITLRGPLSEERLERVRRSRASWLRWEPAAPVDLLSWAQLTQLPAWRAVRLTRPIGGHCEGTPPLRAPRAWIHDSDPLPCGTGLLVRVPPHVSDQTLRAIYRADPGAELELEIGADEKAAQAARELLDRLEAATGRPAPLRAK